MPGTPRRQSGRRRQEERSAASRRRVVRAAAAEFAARGFAGANVDRIARAARVNKAMIYYHFTSKAALYREILRDMFEAVAVRVDQASQMDSSPDDKVRAFVEAIAIEAEARPHFPPIWFREIAENGTHLDPPTMLHMRRVVTALGRILREGIDAGRFRPINPLLVHAGVVGPLLLYFASAQLRRRLENAGVPGAAMVPRDQVVAHVQRLALIALRTSASSEPPERSGSKGPLEGKNI
ncbi:MAG TPA: TetR/AcrR family transcriptional regulator [Vicinamibacterales bacterium]|nr:TetR/AcrR family transcriptional regulator [Vicinamibacterales bacterium]